MPNNDFSELDYKPGNKRRYLLPALIVVTVLFLMVVLFIIPGNRDENGVDLADNKFKPDYLLINLLAALD